MTTDFKARAGTVAQGAALIARAAPRAMKNAGALCMGGGPAALHGADALRAFDQMAGDQMAGDQMAGAAGG
jgi:hypothetical protein